MTTYLKILPVDLQKEIIKKRYLEVLKELESVTDTILSYFHVHHFDYRNNVDFCFGIRLRVRTNNCAYVIPQESTVKHAKLGNFDIKMVFWYVGLHHSEVPFQTLSKLITKKKH
jgi:hypothetical protein